MSEVPNLSQTLAFFGACLIRSVHILLNRVLYPTATLLQARPRLSSGASRHPLSPDAAHFDAASSLDTVFSFR